MHIFFSGIGGAGIGPLALIAHQAGYVVSGSDKKESAYTEYLKKHGVKLYIGQTTEQIAAAHADQPIDWLVMSSAVPLENPEHPELVFAQQQHIKISKRDELLNVILQDKNLKLIAIAGTHGKTTATAMSIWAFQKLGIPISYSVGAKTSFADMGHFDEKCEYFVYECDEFDRNFLAFSPYASTITTVDWDHHDIYPTRDEYTDAFRSFIQQSTHTTMHKKDADYLGLAASESITVLSEESDHTPQSIALPGAHNRQNALVVAQTLARLLERPVDELTAILSTFPGSERRFEKLAPNVYTDYAHTPEEILATIQLAKELNDHVVVVYEPLTNKRQHFMKDLYKDIFTGVDKIYWLPSYLAREDPTQHVLTPEELIAGLSNPERACVSELSPELIARIRENAQAGSLVLCLAGGGGGSLDEYLRTNLKVQ